MSQAVIQALNFGIFFAVTTFLFALIFKVLPDAYVRWRDVWARGLPRSMPIISGKGSSPNQMRSGSRRGPHRLDAKAFAGFYIIGSQPIITRDRGLPSGFQTFLRTRSPAPNR